MAFLAHRSEYMCINTPLRPLRVAFSFSEMKDAFLPPFET